MSDDVIGDEVVDGLLHAFLDPLAGRAQDKLLAEHLAQLQRRLHQLRVADHFLIAVCLTDYAF